MVVAASALVSALARRESASGRGLWLALPGLGVLVWSEGCLLRGGDEVGLLEVVEFDAESFAAAKVVEEGIVGLFCFGLVFLGKVDEV